MHKYAGGVLYELFHKNWLVVFVLVCAGNKQSFHSFYESRQYWCEGASSAAAKGAERNLAVYDYTGTSR